MRRAAAAILASMTLATAHAAPATIPLQMPSGRTLQAEVMIDPPDRARGLMFRDSLPEDRAMLFVFDDVGFHTIWMKDCRFPIDIVWLDEAQRVVHVAEAVPPCRKDPCPVYQPMQRAAYVVEMNARQARREKATVGQTISFRLPD